MDNFKEYKGIFKCHTCKKEVYKIRLYTESLILSWICPEKHISKVNLSIKGY